jgi:glyoxylase-like metal-dependent hydrolase (beta-lactamase superfamily II)
MRIVSHTGGIAGTNCFLVVDDVTKQSVLFDAPDHTVAPLLDMIEKEGLSLIGLWLTHGHFDHLADHQVVRDRFPEAKILIHKLDEPKLLKPGSRIFPLPFEIPPGKADGFVEDGQTLSIGQTTLQVLFTPRHSPGHVSYFFANGDKPVLIGGDLIIGGAVGRTDLPDSNPADLDASIRKVMALPPETTLLGGHGEPTTLADEATQNPYVRRALRS